MNGHFTLHCQSKIHCPAPREDLPTGRVVMLGKPRIGECLVIVGEDRVLQTSVVRSYQATESTVVVDTSNSRYILTAHQADATNKAEAA